MNTLGRRIQEGRKAAGLSRESLGKRLEVSRQAESKWEADAAIPELAGELAKRGLAAPVQIDLCICRQLCLYAGDWVPGMPLE